MQLTLETRNDNRNELRVTARRVPRKSALRGFDLGRKDVPGELATWFERFDARTEFTRGKFGRLLAPKNGGAR